MSTAAERPVVIMEDLLIHTVERALYTDATYPCHEGAQEAGQRLQASSLYIEQQSQSFASDREVSAQ